MVIKRLSQANFMVDLRFESHSDVRPYLITLQVFWLKKSLQGLSK